MPADNEIYTSMAALSRAKDIPLDHLKAAKVLACAGYTPSGRWIWAEFSVWYRANQAEILEYLAENDSGNGDNGEWKARKERAQALIAEIQLRDLQEKTLDKAKVVSLIKSLASSQAIIFRNLADTLPHKLLGKNISEIQTELQKEYQAICQLFQKPIKEWETLKDE